MTDHQKLQAKIVQFVKDRDWHQFHNPKDLAISLNLEAAEVLELFQWKNEAEMADFIKKNKGRIKDELADVIYWALLMSYYFDFDVIAAGERKLAKNAKKYPVKKARGNHKKYTEL